MRSTVILLWLCFVCRGAFYCSLLPLWEGFDEWAHFAVAQRMSVTGSLLIDRNSVVSREIQASLELAPLPRGMTSMPPGGVTRDAYLSLPSGERERRERDLAHLPPSWAAEEVPGAMPAYEAGQPPLYYWLMAIPLRLLSDASLLDRVWVLRFATLLLGSLVIPIAFATGRLFFGSESAALGFTLIVAAMPGLAFAVTRVSNDGLAIVLFSLLLLAVLRWLEQPAMSRSLAIGVLLGLGLLSKAYFLTAIPALAVVCALIARKPRQAAGMLAVALALSGWWYVRTVLQTGTLSGLDEALMLRETGFVEKAVGAFRVDWPRAVATILLSHIWYGGWSLLALPRWIYFLWFAAIGVSGYGVVKALRKSTDARILALLVFYGFFWLGQAYHVTMLFLSKGASTAMGGWYLQSLIVAETILLLVGFFALVPASRQRHVFLALLVALAATDLYGLHAVSIPYYALLTPVGFASLWAAYLASTAALVLRGFRTPEA